MADLRTVERRLQRVDKALRLRDPGGESPVVYVERRGREGRFLRIGEAKKEWLGDGTALLATLRKNDLWEGGGGEKVGKRLDEDEAYWKGVEKRKRKEHFIDLVREDRDTIHRLRGKRVSNAGVPT